MAPTQMMPEEQIKKLSREVKNLSEMVPVKTMNVTASVVENLVLYSVTPEASKLCTLLNNL